MVQRQRKMEGLHQNRKNNSPGNFWHGNPKKLRIPKSNCEYWEGKIMANRKFPGVISVTPMHPIRR